MQISLQGNELYKFNQPDTSWLIRLLTNKINKIEKSKRQEE